jgi:hypothetical protein
MSTHDTQAIADLKSRIKEVRFPMFTWQDEHGHLLSQPTTAAASGSSRRRRLHCGTASGTVRK